MWNHFYQLLDQDGEHLYKMFNNFYYNTLYKYCIIYILTSDYSIDKVVTEFLIKKFGKEISFIDVSIRKLCKVMSLVLSIQEVRQNIGKHLKECVYNSFANLEVECIRSSPLYIISFFHLLPI